MGRTSLHGVPVCYCHAGTGHGRVIACDVGIPQRLLEAGAARRIEG